MIRADNGGPPSNHLAAADKRDPKNKVRKCGVFFDARKQPSKTPRSPRISPQSHQQKTPFSRPLFPKHPSKTPKIDTISPLGHPKKILSKIYLQSEENVVKSVQKRREKDTEDETPTHQHQDDHAKHSNPVIKLQCLIRKKVAQNMAAIQRRN